MQNEVPPDPGSCVLGAGCVALVAVTFVFSLPYVSEFQHWVSKLSDADYLKFCLTVLVSIVIATACAFFVVKDKNREKDA